MSNTILQQWDLTPQQLTHIIDENPSLRGMMLGYVAELKLEQLWLSDQRISDVFKHDDHDRRRKGDRVVKYKGREYVFEVKSLQTASVQKTTDGWRGKAQVDASDRREVSLPDGSTVTTTCLLRGEFDILAVNLFAFDGTWRFVFAKNLDLPSSRYRRYTEYQRHHLLATLIEVTWPPRPPFYSEPFTLLEEII